MFLRRAVTFALALVSPAVLASCSDDDGTGPAGTGTIVLQFDHTVDGAALQMNTGTYTNAAGNEYSVSKLEYTLSEFALAGAGAVTDDGIHYRDAGDASTATLTLDDVPAGTYTSLTFRHGIPGSMNAAGALPDLDAVGMAWPAMMGGGYHYMRNEGTFEQDGGGVGNFTTHTGPSMGNDFSFTVNLSLPSGAVVENGETLTIRVEMDVNEWYSGPNMWDFNDYGLIMGNQAAQGLLRANGATVWSVGSVN